MVYVFLTTECRPAGGACDMPKPIAPYAPKPSGPEGPGKSPPDIDPLPDEESIPEISPERVPVPG